MGNILIENGKEVGALSGPISASNCMLSDGTNVEEAIAYNELYNQSTSLTANTLTDIVEFTTNHPVTLSTWYAVTSGTDTLDILLYIKENGTYKNIAGVSTTGTDTLTAVIPKGTYKVTIRSNTTQTSRPCIVAYR